ncbi:hypothetical protein Tco_0763705 [Tanacetum coccineum]
MVVGFSFCPKTAATYTARGYLQCTCGRQAIGFRREQYGERSSMDQRLKDLELHRHGLKLLKRSPSSFTPCLDGRYLLLGPDVDLNHSEILKLSKRDAKAYPRLYYC